MGPTVRERTCSKSIGSNVRIRTMSQLIDTASFGICPAVLILSIQIKFQKVSAEHNLFDAPAIVRLWEGVGAHHEPIHDLTASSGSVTKQAKKKPLNGRQRLTREQRREHLHEELGIRAFPNRHYRNPGDHCMVNELQKDNKIHFERATHRTNNCCAMTFLRDRLSNNIATPPATAPATIECHRADFLWSQIWRACAADESRATGLLSTRGLSGNEFCSMSELSSSITESA